MEPLEFLSLVWAIDHQLQVASKRMHARIGVTGPQRVAIRVIGAHPGIGPSEVAKALHIHPSTLTGILRRLELNGFVHREGHAVDRRRALLHLTAEGSRINAISEGTIESAVSMTLAGRSPESIGAATELLEALAATLQTMPT